MLSANVALRGDHRVTLPSDDIRTRLAAALEVAGLAAWDTDLATGDNVWDERLAGMLGVPAAEAEAASRRWLSFIHPDDRDRVAAELAAASVDGAPPFDTEFRVVRTDGVERWFASRGSVVVEGGRRRMIGVVQDITGRKRVEAELRESRERLQAALLGSGAGTFRWNLTTNLAEWDESLSRLFGLAPGRSVRTLEEFLATIHPDDRDAVAARCQRCVDEGVDFEMEFRVVWADGTVRWLYDRGRTSLDEAGRPAWMTGMCLDVTNRRRADEQLARERKRADALAKALDRASQPFVIGAPDGRLLLFNRAYAELTGYGDEELRASSWVTTLTPPEWREHEAAVLAELHRTREPQLYAKEYVRKDGRRVPVEINVSLMTSEDDGGDIYYAFVTDVTDRLAAEEALREADRRKDEFLATLAHELRNPLAPIRNGIEILRRRGASDEVAIRVQNTIERQLTHVVRLVDDLSTCRASRAARSSSTASGSRWPRSSITPSRPAARSSRRGATSSR